VHQGCGTGIGFSLPSRVDFFSKALRVLKPGGHLVTADIVPKRTFLKTRFRKEVDRLGWRGASPKAVRRAANVAAYRDLLLDVGFAAAETRSIAGDVYRPLARFLCKRLFEPDMKYVNPVVRWTAGPTIFGYTKRLSTTSWRWRRRRNETSTNRT
jgi:hypothetical protein